MDSFLRTCVRGYERIIQMEEVCLAEAPSRETQTLLKRAWWARRLEDEMWKLRRRVRGAYGTMRKTRQNLQGNRVHA